MLAKLKDSYRFDTAVFFSGLEFTKTTWTPIPAGLEEEAMQEPALEVTQKGLDTLQELDAISKPVKPAEKTKAELIEPDTEEAETPRARRHKGKDG